MNSYSGISFIDVTVKRTGFHKALNNYYFLAKK